MSDERLRLLWHAWQDSGNQDDKIEYIRRAREIGAISEEKFKWLWFKKLEYELAYLRSLCNRDGRSRSELLAMQPEHNPATLELALSIDFIVVVGREDFCSPAGDESSYDIDLRVTKIGENLIFETLCNNTQWIAAAKLKELQYQFIHGNRFSFYSGSGISYLPNHYKLAEKLLKGTLNPSHNEVPSSYHHLSIESTELAKVMNTFCKEPSSSPSSDFAPDESKGGHLVD